MTTAAIRTENLAIGYPKYRIAEGITISLQPGSVTAMLGENGAGKSTLIKTITGELKPLSGEVILCGTPLKDYFASALARCISLVTTDKIQAGALKVHELVSLGRQPYTGFFGRLTQNDKDIVKRAIADVGITHKADSYVAELSDGEKQKALIARAIAQQTRIILLDEPFSFLDVASRVEILALLIKSARANGTTILFSSHDVAQALRMADDILMFTPEKKIIHASPERLVKTGEISRLFQDRDVIFDAAQNDFITENI